MLPFGQQAFAFRLSAGKGAYFGFMFRCITALYLCSVSLNVWSVPALFLFCFCSFLSLLLLFFSGMSPLFFILFLHSFSFSIGEQGCRVVAVAAVRQEGHNDLTLVFRAFSQFDRSVKSRAGGNAD